MKKDAIFQDDVYMRCKELIDSWTDFVLDIFTQELNEKEFKIAVADFAKEIYNIGYDDACALCSLVEEDMLN